MASKAKKACNECRQQKAKCDVSEGVPCSRCTKLNIACVISDNFKREHKRKRLVDLEQEAEHLRRQLATPRTSLSSSTFTNTSNNHHGLHTLSDAATSRIEGRLTSPASRVRPNAVSSLSSQRDGFTFNQGSSPFVSSGWPKESTAHEAMRTPDPPNASFELSSDAPVLSTAQSPTTSRTLDGVTIDPKTIDTLFSEFYRSYHPHLPIVQPEMPPNSLYNYSPFLFWAIVGVAARTHQDDPTLLNVLTDRIIQIALLSFRKTAISTVQGILLLLTWPLPTGGLTSCVTCPFAAAILHLGERVGLHTPSATRDFLKATAVRSESDLRQRVCLWGYCLLVSQRTTIMLGQMPLMLPSDAEQRKTFEKYMDRDLMFPLRLQKIVSQACNSLHEIGLRENMAPDKEDTLNTLIQVYEHEIENVEILAKTDADALNIQFARLSIRSFHYYKRDISAANAIALFTAACKALEIMQAMQDRGSTLATSPLHYVHTSMQAAFTLLRLAKTSCQRFIDYERARKLVFVGINMAHGLSSDPKDVAAKLVKVLKDLWHSQKVFKYPDGSECRHLRVRSRLVMSHVHDSVWWWREEFQGQTAVFAELGTKTTPVENDELPSSVFFSDFQFDDLLNLDWNFTDMPNFSAG